MKEVWNETNLMGMIFDIQRFSVHDGPGIRTTIFLKGCNLRCLWCHNPESFISKPQLQLFIHNCIGCGKCFEVCSFKAHQMLNDKRIFQRDKCTGCGSCARSCFSQALTITGREISVYDVINEIKKDIPFYANTSGGVTFSGGEALLQRDFVLACLKECKMLDIHTVIDTAGNVSWETFKSVLPFTDLFLYDIKVLDDAKHLEFTGSGNKVIKSNLVKLADAGANIIVRIPVIPDINDTCSDMKEISDFLNGIKGIRIVELLEFHSLAEGKYTSLGLEYKMKGFEKMSLEKMRQLAEVFIENRFETVF